MKTETLLDYLDRRWLGLESKLTESHRAICRQFGMRMCKGFVTLQSESTSTIVENYGTCVYMVSAVHVIETGLGEWIPKPTYLFNDDAQCHVPNHIMNSCPVYSLFRGFSGYSLKGLPIGRGE